MQKEAVLQIDWNRAIFINSIINDDLFDSLTPKILKMRQENNDPITIGIDSTGGSLASLESIMDLLCSPGLDGVRPIINTVTLNKAFSAAANLLAMGDYAIAYPSSKIFFHDVRYHSIPDVTPSKALQTAKDLERKNEEFAFYLSPKISVRLVWTYINFWSSFEEVKKDFSEAYNDYYPPLSEFMDLNEGDDFDFAAFILSLYRPLHR